MDGARSPSLSLRQRLRYLCTLACALMVGLGLWAILSHHPVHGGLALLAAQLLLPASVLGRKARGRVPEAATV